MSDKIGKLYTEAEVTHIAKKRADEDASHDIVEWVCQWCLVVKETLVSQKLTAKQCTCGRWLQWHYLPKQVA